MASADYPAELCRLWKADLSDLLEAGKAVKPSTQAIFDALAGDGDLHPFYDALVGAERVSREAADRTAELELRTHAGRVTATIVVEAQRGDANAHRRFIGRSTDFESWSRGPSSQANFSRWTRVLEGAQSRLAPALQDPSLTPALIDDECRKSADGLSLDPPL
jgi:hypothetical protein